jgi:adenylate cyclase
VDAAAAEAMMTTTAEQASARPRIAVWERLLRLWRRAAVKALIGAQLVALAVVLVRAQGWLQPLELLLYDTLRVAWAGHAVGHRLVLVGATEKDIGHYGWPLRDGDLAALLERLESWQPRVIGVDIYRDIPQPPGSDALDAVLKRYPNILWVFKLQEGKHPRIQPPQQLIGSDRAVLADTIADPDHIVRRGLLFADDGQNQYTAMGTALALGYLAPEHIALGAGPTPDSLKLGKSVIVPLDDTSGPYLKMDSAGYQMLMDYRGGRDPFPIESVTGIMTGDKAAEAKLAAMVRSRAIVVGVHAESVQDALGTPFNTGFGNADPVPGIAIHAHVADQLIRQALSGAPTLTGLARPFEDGWIWAWAMLGALLGLGIRATVPAVAGAGAGLVALGGIVYVAFGLNLLLPALPAGFAWLGAAGLTNQLLHAASNRARARLRRSFEHYLPPALISQMVQADKLPTLGGEHREISVLFSDVASFTTMSEAIDPVDLALLTNSYFAGVGEAIFAQGGYINDLMGDGVLAFFGAPVPQSDHADRAVAAGLGVAQFGQRFSDEQRARSVPFGHTRVGVHCGIAMVGNIGTPEALKYTALGDMLNTGSRLEGLNKAIGTRICVSDAIVRKSTRCRFRKIGDFVVKGRHEPSQIYEPVDTVRYSEQHLQRYEAAYAALAAGRPEAARLFAELHRDDPEDPCAAFHHHRLEDGESGTLIVMTEK